MSATPAAERSLSTTDFLRWRNPPVPLRYAAAVLSVAVGAKRRAVAGGAVSANASGKNDELKSLAKGYQSRAILRRVEQHMDAAGAP